MLRDTEAVASLFGVTIMEMVYLYGTASIVAQVPNGKWFILGEYTLSSPKDSFCSGTFYLFPSVGAAVGVDFTAVGGVTERLGDTEDFGWMCVI